MRGWFTAFAALSLALGAAACQGQAYAAENIVRAPVAQRQAEEGSSLKTAIFAGGCFWGVEAVFSHVKGVKSVIAGYHGGSRADATYGRVSTGRTGHAEAVKVVYDPSKVRYDQLLQIFFSVVADPTLTNRQGPDIGKQYRSALVPQSSEQRIVARMYLKQMQASGKWPSRIVTPIENPRTFYRAEQYHQDFGIKHPHNGYFLRWDAPKIAALKKLYPKLYRASFVIN
ncbi:peptide-methionine (S)-S-oxide reductase MsrA [Altererythrobacter indicus]|uniref:Peptide methionine sulfoxide reductase MsrA n=1 Tax=Altericroceibacterium indicum TaxID=374177 RepID=A0A845AH06_9SPHN|nr:peptide-methionine (S)-S-oxide reductase MsrA [Altericroceibacterium indicum]MXP26388.1 peptide-methionine (S)-S-oxide reductase MsrA [Altericroceibacterium indicum]